LADLTARAQNRESKDQAKGMYVLPDFHDFPNEFEFLSWDLEPGDCLIFQIDIVHYAYGNTSNRRRRALSTRWFDDGCTVDESKPHILGKAKILQFIENCGFKWNGNTNNPLFPKFIFNKR